MHYGKPQHQINIYSYFYTFAIITAHKYQTNIESLLPKWNNKATNLNIPQNSIKKIHKDFVSF